MAEVKGKKMSLPAGRCQWAHIIEPNTKWKKEGEWSIDMIYDPDDADFKLFQAEATELLEAAFEDIKRGLKPAKAKALWIKYPWKDELDEEGEETGNVIVKCRRDAVVTYEDGNTKHYTIKLFDAAAKQIKKLGTLVGNGSVVKVNIYAKPYYMAARDEVGLSLKPNAVQILELVEFGADASSFGFGQEEDGFVYEEENEYSTSNHNEANPGDF